MHSSPDRPPRRQTASDFVRRRPCRAAADRCGQALFRCPSRHFRRCRPRRDGPACSARRERMWSEPDFERHTGGAAASPSTSCARPRAGRRSRCRRADRVADERGRRVADDRHAAARRFVHGDGAQPRSRRACLPARPAAPPGRAHGRRASRPGAGRGGRIAGRRQGHAPRRPDRRRHLADGILVAARRRSAAARRPPDRAARHRGGAARGRPSTCSAAATGSRQLDEIVRVDPRHRAARRRRAAAGAELGPGGRRDRRHRLRRRRLHGHAAGSTRSSPGGPARRARVVAHLPFAGSLRRGRRGGRASS